MQTDGALVVLTEPRPGTETAFHNWYDTEHGPARVRLPGVASGYRYRADDDTVPTWLAWYEMSLDVFATTAYQNLREHRSIRERQVMASLHTLDRRIYRLAEGVAVAGAPPPLLLAKSLEVPTDASAALHRWYVEEHIPLLQRVPGWLHTRLYRLEDGSAPRHLALHGICERAAFDTDAYRHAVSTPWREQVMSGVTASERRLFAFHSRIDAQ